MVNYRRASFKPTKCSSGQQRCKTLNHVGKMGPLDVWNGFRMKFSVTWLSCELCDILCRGLFLNIQRMEVQVVQQQLETAAKIILVSIFRENLQVTYSLFFANYLTHMKHKEWTLNAYFSMLSPDIYSKWLSNISRAGWKPIATASGSSILDELPAGKRK